MAQYVLCIKMPRVSSSLEYTFTPHNSAQNNGGAIWESFGQTLNKIGIDFVTTCTFVHFY